MLANWTKATTTTTGTGTITLTAVTGFPLPSKSRGTGEYVQYSIHTSDGKFESGIGKIAASDTLERTKVFSTYDGTTYNQLTASALTLASGTHDVFITPMAEAIYEPLVFPLVGPANQAVFSTHLNTTTVGVAISAPTVSVWPFRLETCGVVSAMACSVLTAGDASSRILLGLYEADNNGRPARRLCKTSAVIDTSSTGYKTQSVDTNVRLNPGWYWAALVVTAGTAPAITGASDPGISAFGATAVAAIHRVYESASASDLADPFPSTSLTYLGGNTDIPLIGLIF